MPQVAPSASEELRDAVTAKLNDLTKPPGSLGMLEEIVVQYCLCKGDADARFERKALRVFAGDHGIVAEGVAPYPREVTTQMVHNMLAGGAAVTVMCRLADIPYKVVDMGVAAEFADHPLLLKHKVAMGTASFLEGNAMTPEQCAQALAAGEEVAADAACDIAAVGEMGIGNTSPASALVALLLGVDGATAVGRGTGADGDLLDQKRRVIHEAVKFHHGLWDGTAVDALARVGGFEIAGMAGFILGCAERRVPVVVDGFIATAAAFAAIHHTPAVADYLFWGHVSDEQFHQTVLEKIGARPLLQLGMRLGEGTGAVLALHVIEQALNCYHNMATFSSAGVTNRD